MGTSRDDDHADILNVLTPENLAPIKRSVVVAGHPTSVTLEPPFWRQLDRAARSQARSVNALVTQIDDERAENSRTLSAAIRLYLIERWHRDLGYQNKPS
jgi:predicted DNA-binding ribbon-helix-helix protein